MGIVILTIVSPFSICVSIVSEVSSIGMSLCTLSSSVCILLGELFVLISSDKVLLIVCVMCVTLYFAEGLLNFCLCTTRRVVFVLLKSEGVFGDFLRFCPPLIDEKILGIMWRFL